MTATIRISATKPSPNSEVGIKFVADDSGMVITGILEGSMFSSTGLQAGHKVLRINGSPVPPDGNDWVKQILGSSETVVFDIKTSWSATLVVQPNNGIVTNAAGQDVPLFLARKGVSLEDWQIVYEAINLELLPALVASTTYIRGATGFGLESSHEKKMFEKTHHAANLAASATLAVINAIVIANSVMSAYGLRCQLDLETYEVTRYSYKQSIQRFMGKRVRGIEFIPVK
eukprot:scaffold992_cov116-Cylindrotheca_fusiformis.AAC.6